MARILILAAYALMLGQGPSFAHHSVSGYDMKAGAFVAGTVKEFRWANPHVMLTVEVADSQGKLQDWTFETLSVGQLEAANFRKNTVAAGDRVTVSFFPRRDGRTGGFMYALMAADGKLYIVQKTRRPQGLELPF